MFLLSEEGFDSFIEHEDGFLGYLPFPGTHLVDAPFSPPDLIEELLLGKGVKGTWNRIPEQNWNEEWEKNYNPVLISNRCFIRAPFHEPKPEVDYEIVIEPKMSFGTAHHETTSMMIEHILELDCAGKRVLDMGCGTGVLAILAKMKGADQVTAIDHDEWSYLNSKENVERNGFPDIVTLQGDVQSLPGMWVDIILANINRNILLDQLPAYASILSNGQLLMSGFYTEDLPIITEAAAKVGFSYQQHLTKNNWVAAIYQK